MAFGNFDPHKSNTHSVAEINMVPLIDVMLVLLIIFMITAPLMTHSVKINLPKASSQVQNAEQDTVTLAINADQTLFWNTEPVTRVARLERLQRYAQETTDPELYLRADQDVAYRLIAETLADAAKAGISRIGFVSEPESHAVAAEPKNAY
jgi:biopolymer transport protein ExbD